MKNAQKNVIDWQSSIKLANNKPELAEQMLGMLIDELPGAKKDIMDAYQAKDYKNMRNHIHKLHGASCYTGVTRLKYTASEIETLLKTDIDEEKLKQLLNEFDQLVAEILKAFEDGNFK